MEEKSEESEGNTKAAVIMARLDTIANCAEGYFIRKAVAQNDSDRRAFAHIVKRHPDNFREIVEDTGIYRLTSGYLSRRGILKLMTSHTISDVEPLRRAIWGLFIIEHRFDLSFTDAGHKLLGSSYKVDNFRGDYADFKGIVITIPQRADVIKAQTLISPLVMGKIVRSSLDRYLSGLPAVGQSLNMEDVLRLNFLPGGIWPESEDECHTDQRQYPKWSAPVSGRAKWKADREMLQTGKVIPGYKFGVYPA